MQYSKIEIDKEVNNLCELWNNEFGFIFPITPELMKKNFLEEDKNLNIKIEINKQIVGFILAKIWNNDEIIPNYINKGWISLIYIKKEYRNKGLGTELINRIENEFNKNKVNEIYLGKDYYNFFPGVPFDFKKNIEWFEKRGFIKSYFTNDLIRINDERNEYIIKNKDFVFENLHNSDKDQFLNFIQKNWPGRWHKEALDYFKYNGEGNEYIVCKNKTNEIVGFCKIGDQSTDIKLSSYALNWRARFTNLGGVGPLGIDKNYRKLGLGYDIVAYSINQLIKKGTSHIIIDWTNLLDFYRKFNFEIWKSYQYMSKGEKQ